MTLLITKEETERLLSIDTTIPVIEEAFRMTGNGDAENLPRVSLDAKRGSLHFGAAALHSKNIMGYKLSTNFGGPGKSVDHLYSMESNELLAIVEAWSISRLRTAAATAVAVKYLSPDTADVVGMYGTGRQAEAQLEAVCKVRPIRTAHVYSRTPENRQSFSQKMSRRLNIEIIPAARPELVPQEADIIVAITTSDSPVMFGKWITRPGLIIGAGANKAFKREFDSELVAMAKLVIVDEKEQSKVESGNLLWAMSKGLLNWNHVHSLGDVVAGRVAPPSFSSGILLFLLHGPAFLDVAIASKTYELARERQIGREISL